VLACEILFDGVKLICGHIARNFKYFLIFLCYVS
jgi:hypothetical protein